MIKTITPLLTALLLGGCSVHTPPIEEYTIFTSPAQSPAPSIHTKHTLSIVAPRTPASLSSKGLIYLYDDGKSGSYLYSRWSDTPAEMIRRNLTASLEESGLFAALLSPASAAQPDWVLESDLGAFYHRFTSKDASEGYIDITYRLIDPKQRSPLTSKRFAVSVAAEAPNAKSGAEALRQATFKLNRECIEWLTNILKENP